MRPRSDTRWRAAGLYAAAFVLGAAAPAAAQRLVLGQSPLQGVTIPAETLLTDDATALTFNPAGLALARGGSFVYAHTHADRAGTHGVGGDGFYLAAAPLLGRVAAGLGFELLRPPHAFVPAATAQKLAFGLAFKLAPGVGLGVTWNHLFSSAAPDLNGLDSLDLGLTLRPAAHVGFAYVLRDLNVPAVTVLGGRQPLSRAHDFQLGLRPFGDERLEVTGGVRLWSWDDVEPTAQLSIRIWRGLFVEGNFQAPQLTLYDPATGARETVRDWRGAAGLRVDFDHFTAGLYALMGQHRLGGGDVQGITALLKITEARQTPLWYGPAQVRRVTLEGDGSDRDFADLMLALRAAERDPSVAAVLLEYQGLHLGWGRIEEVRAAITRLKRLGRPVYAWADDLATRSYYMLAGCDRIWVDPAAEVRLIGFASNLLFFKGTFDKLGVKADFVRIAEYKSAPEAYTRKDSSEPARRMRNEMLDDISGRLTAAIARDRRIDPAALAAIVNQGPLTPSEAQSRKLVDAVKFKDEVDELVAEALGAHVRVRGTDDAPRRYGSWSPPRIAVVFVDGDIVDGRSRELPILDQRVAGGDSVAAAIRAARADPDTRAIVLRINSPGGSVTASDQIAREVLRTRGKKPIICSMGDVAASGGYYVAAPCDRVFAEPSTITGSIGIFTGKFDVHGLTDALGLTVEPYVRGAHADIGSMFRGWTDEERATLERQLRYSYDRFLEIVAAGRKLTTQRVNEIGRGRVWTGSQGVGLKLVDAEGGLLEAIDYAKQRGGLSPREPAQIWMLPHIRRTLLDRVIDFIGVRARERAEAERVPLPAAVRAALRAIPPALLHSRPGAALYRLDFEPVWE